MATIVVQAKFAQTGRVACLVVVRRQNVEESVLTPKPIASTVERAIKNVPQVKSVQMVNVA